MVLVFGKALVGRVGEIDIAGLLGILTAYAKGQFIVQDGAGNDTGHLLAVKFAIQPLEFVLGLECRILAFDHNGATEGIAPLQGALWPAVYLQLCHIPQAAGTAFQTLGGLRYTIDHHRNQGGGICRLGDAVGIEAADRDAFTAGTLREGTHVGHALIGIAGIGNIIILHVFRGDDANAAEGIDIGSLELFTDDQYFFHLAAAIAGLVLRRIPGFLCQHRGTQGDRCCQRCRQNPGDAGPQVFPQGHFS